MVEIDLELQLAKPLTVCKTLVLPVDTRITRKKVKFLDKLTARLTYGVQLFLEKLIAVRCAVRASLKSRIGRLNALTVALLPIEM